MIDFSPVERLRPIAASSIFCKPKQFFVRSQVDRINLKTTCLSVVCERAIE